MNNTVELGEPAPLPGIRTGPRSRTSPREPRPTHLQKGYAWQLRSFVLFVCAGYLVQGRAFAYLGVPGLYPGEALLLWAALRREGGWWGTFRSELRAKPLLPLSLILFLAWGAIETLRGVGSGGSLEDSLRGIAAHYYPLLLYVGLSAARYISFDLIREYFNKLNVLIGLAAVASALINDRYHSGLLLPWTKDVVLPGAPALPCLAFVFAVAFARRNDVRFVIPCLIAMLAMLLGPRSSILGGVAGLFVLLCRPKRWAMTALLLAGAAGTFGFVSVLLPEFIPDFGGRVGALTPARITARVTAIVDEDLASKIASRSGEDDSFVETEAGSAEWRKTFWNGVIDSMATSSDWIIGHGYGFSLGSLMKGASGIDESLRTPHNFAIYLLGYTGLVGCAFYACILLAFIAAVVRCPNSPIKDGIIAGGLSVLVMALSGNLFETPFGAVPSYLAFGILLGLAREWKPTSSGRSSRSLASHPRPPRHLSAEAPPVSNSQVLLPSVSHL